MKKFILLTLSITLLSFSLTTIKETIGKDSNSKQEEQKDTEDLSKKKIKKIKSADVDKEDKKEEKKIKINESEFKPVLLGALLENPQDFIGKKIKFRGKFSSFTTLALDYEPALRKSKDYISLCIFRPDSKIPLSELKLAYPVKEAKENPVIRELDEGDLVEIYAEVFSSALDEPWADILSIKMLEHKKQTEKAEEKAASGKNKKGKKDSK